jgi:hypothetical protein
VAGTVHPVVRSAGNVFFSVRMYETQESARKDRNQVRQIINVSEVWYVGINPIRKISVPNLRCVVSASYVRSGEQYSLWAFHR